MKVRSRNNGGWSSRRRDCGQDMRSEFSKSNNASRRGRSAKAVRAWNGDVEVQAQLGGGRDVVQKTG